MSADQAFDHDGRAENQEREESKTAADVDEIKARQWATALGRSA